MHKVSIIPHGVGALGYTIQRPTEARYLMTAEELKDKMAVLLGWRAAEVLVFDELSTGASDDLGKATKMARNMVTRYGMDKTLGQVTYADPQPAFLGDIRMPTSENRLYSDDTARDIDNAIRSLIDGAFSRATEILGQHRDLLDATAVTLLEQETLSADELPVIQLKESGDASQEAPE